MAAWTALVHHGTRRVLAGVVAVVALVGLVALLDLRSIVRIIVVIGLVLVSAAAARVALAHDLAAATFDGRKVGPARSGVLLMNPWSGGGKVDRFGLEAEARRRGVTPVVLRRGDDLRALAEQAVDTGAEVIGMAGGDGSQALVADVARRHDVAFVCVPAGTRIHFALDLGLDRADVAAALDAYGDALERRIDLATIGDRVFVNNASMGVYATVVQSEAYRDAKLATTAQLLPDLLGPAALPFDLRFHRPGGDGGTSVHLVLVSNDVYRLESMSGFGTRPRIDDGVLGVVTVAVDRARDLPALVAAEASGRIRRFPGLSRVGDAGLRRGLRAAARRCRCRRRGPAAGAAPSIPFATRRAARPHPGRCARDVAAPRSSPPHPSSPSADEEGDDAGRDHVGEAGPASLRKLRMSQPLLIQPLVSGDPSRRSPVPTGMSGNG
jgi:diacylglycerol kinase family enzyme